MLKLVEIGSQHAAAKYGKYTPIFSIALVCADRIVKFHTSSGYGGLNPTEFSVGAVCPKDRWL